MDLAARLDAATSRLAVGPILRRALWLAGGKDARDYLHRMCTQDVNGLGIGGSAHAAFLEARGHLLGEGQLLATGDGVLLDLDPAAAEATLGQLQRLVIMDEVTFEDRSEALRVLPLLGPGAEEAARAHAPGAWTVVHRRRGVPALDLVVPAGEVEPLRARLEAAGAVPLDEGDLEVLRVLGGQARWGVDMDGARLPMEAGLTGPAIHFGKGCYPGQEVVLRATVRGQVQRGLVQLALPAGAGAGARLRAGGVEVGWVTSAVDGPDGRVGLGYLRRAHWAPGERLQVDGGEAVVRRALVEEKVGPPAAPAPPRPARG